MPELTIRLRVAGQGDMQAAFQALALRPSLSVRRQPPQAECPPRADIPSPLA
jgi:hypothetical protein